MMLALTPDGPLDVDGTLARYHLWGEDPANRLGPGRFRRAARVGGRIWGYEVTWTGGLDDTRLGIRVPRVHDERIQSVIRREVEQIFGLAADLPGFYRMAKGDPELAPLIEPLYGLRPSLAPAPLDMLVTSICAQQVNLAFAFATRGRLVRRYGDPVAIGGEVVYAFPDAAVLARARRAALRRLQFSSRKAEYVVGVARTVIGGTIDFDVLARAGNDEVIATLTRLRGLGRWSAEWFLARYLGRGDVCPAGDLAVRKAFAHYYNRGRALSDAAIRRRARAFGPYQNLAIHYLLAGMRLRPRVGGGT
jgi:DNA-3-methyladenine glycosylase II